MPTTVPAKKGDTLCGLAIDAGFLDCGPLRALGENAAFLNGPLKDGDVVTIPDLDVVEKDKATDTVHTFTKKNSPPVSIRFVHGSPNIPYRQDTTTTLLHVSNYETNLAGTNGRAALPTGFGFNADGHADPDTFKVEVVDPKAGGSLNVKLESLRPVYAAGSGGKFTVTDHKPFTTADAASRRIDDLECERVSATTAFCYRSRYMRIVCDDKDAGAVTKQALLVTDLADGRGTGQPADNDSLEILDQEVRATYVIPRCPGTPKCEVTAQVPIGGGSRQRVRICFHTFRDDIGSDTTFFGLSLDDMRRALRRRTFKWYRRTYAQADMSPKLVDPFVEFLDPPAENMLCISHDHGGTARGGSSINFTLSTATQNVPFTIALTEGETPRQVGDRIASSLPAGFSGQAFTNTLSTGRQNASCDVLITAANGERVTILNQATNPAVTRMTVDVPRVGDMMNIKAQNAEMDGSLSFLTIDFRRVLRSAPVTDDKMHCFVIGEFNRKGLRGIAFQNCGSAQAIHKPPLPFRSSTIMAFNSNSGKVLDDTDNLPFTSPHESAHTLLDIVHTQTTDPNGATQLLSGSGTSKDNAVDATKRLCDGPVTVRMDENTSNGSVTRVVNAVQRLLAKGSAKMESW